MQYIAGDAGFMSSIVVGEILPGQETLQSSPSRCWMGGGAITRLSHCPVFCANPFKTNKQTETTLSRGSKLPGREAEHLGSGKLLFFWGGA